MASSPRFARRSVVWRVIAAVGFLATPAFAQSGRTPLPPARPGVAPTPPASSSPRPVVPSDDADLDPNNPPLLPTAPRSKMHACGRAWQDMKRRGTDRDMTWRQFATGCLQRDNPK